MATRSAADAAGPSSGGFVTTPYPDAVATQTLAVDVASPAPSVVTTLAASDGNGVRAPCGCPPRRFSPWLAASVGLLVLGTLLAWWLSRLASKRRAHRRAASDEDSDAYAIREPDAYGVAPRCLSPQAAPAEVRPARTPRADAADEILPETLTWSSLEAKFLGGAPGTPRMLMVFAPWCGACRRAMPAYIQAANLGAKTTPRALFYRIDGSDMPKDAETRWPWFKSMTGFPSFFTLRATSSAAQEHASTRPVQYRGGRSPEDFVRALVG
jgi:thiol-disulfide isomerase/thioredoxin